MSKAADIIRFTNGDDGVFAHVTAPSGKQYGVDLEHLAGGAEYGDLDGLFFRAVVDRVTAHTTAPETGMDFGAAIQALKRGERVARDGWNGMWLSLSCDGRREIPAENFWSPHNAEFARQNGGKATVLPSITMKTATGEILMGWLASQTDMLAEDWTIVA